MSIGERNDEVETHQRMPMVNDLVEIICGREEISPTIMDQQPFGCTIVPVNAFDGC